MTIHARIRVSALLLALLPFAGAASRCEAVGLLVKPSQMGIVAKPGETARGIFNVSSSRPQKATVNVSLLDYDKTPEGDTIEGPAARSDRSCRDWIRLEPAVVEAPPSGWVPVQVLIEVPANARGTYWALASFVIEPTPMDAAGGPAILVRPRITVPVLVTIAGTETRQAGVSAVHSDLREDGSIEARVTLENTGNTGLMFSGSWTLERTDSDGQVEEILDSPVKPFLLLPGRRLLRKDAIKPRTRPGAGVTAHLYLRYGEKTGDVVDVAVPLAIPESPVTTASPSPAPDRGPK